MPDEPNQTYELYFRIAVEAKDLAAAQLAIGGALLDTLTQEQGLTEVLNRVRVQGPEHGLN